MSPVIILTPFWSLTMCLQLKLLYFDLASFVRYIRGTFFSDSDPTNPHSGFERKAATPSI